mgnify:CR=1 FL=1
MKQLSVYIENQVGSMAKVTNMLKEAGISVKAISVFDSPDFSILRFVVDDVKEAKDVLTSHKVAVRVTDVIAICLEDKTGSLDHFLQICTQNEINIRYMYSFVYRGINNPLLVLSTNEPEQAVRIFEENNIKMINSL